MGQERYLHFLTNKKMALAMEFMTWKIGAKAKAGETARPKHPTTAPWCHNRKALVVGAPCSRRCPAPHPLRRQKRSLTAHEFESGHSTILRALVETNRNHPTGRRRKAIQ